MHMGNLFGDEDVNGYGKGNMTAQELKETGHRLFEARQYAEALPLLKSASEAFPNEEPLWQELVLAAHYNGQHEQAVEFAKQGIRQHPRSGWLWDELGSQLTMVDRLDEAQKALDNARSLLGHSNEFLYEWLWRHFAALHRKRENLEKEIEALEKLYALGKANEADLTQLGKAYYNQAALHRKRKNLEKEIEALEKLYALGKADWADLTQLGIAYRNQQNFAKALEFYRLSATTGDPWSGRQLWIPLFNMGLAFNNPEVSQDADAADAYRRALADNPDYEPAKEQLEATKRKLIPLASRASTDADGLVQLDEVFQFYLSPFEMLQIEEVEAVEELDVKGIQRAKKRLLQEIDLNDGKVGWLDDYPLDKSRALAMEDELHDETKRRYHWAVFQNKRLLGFLTRGDLRHFLYSDDYFPHDTLELLDGEPEFRAFLSKPFARQYNLVLTRAIDRRLLPVVEVLFDGRRWVEREDEDICFEGAYKRIGDLVETMRSKADEGRERKVSLGEMEECFRQHSLPDLFNLLPTAFASKQREIVEAIRSLAISCFNEHNDSDLAKGVLDLCKRFTTRNGELTERLEEDFKTVERMIAEERKHESRLQFGSDRPFEITKEGIRDGATFFPASTVRDLRWGITVTGYTGAEIYEFLFAMRNDAGVTITAAWATSKSGVDEQTEHFSAMVNAAMNYLGVTVIEKVHKLLVSGQQVVIGPCTLTLQGISFQTGFIFKKNRFIAWRDVRINTANGQIVVSSKGQSVIELVVSMRDTDNAVLLPILSAMMEKENSQPPHLPSHEN